MHAIVHTRPAIEMMLRKGISPITNNADALVELGFERAYPQVRNGRDSTIWERSVDLDCRTRDGLRRLVRERAFFVGSVGLRRR